MSFVNQSQYRKVAPARIEQRSEERHRVFLQTAHVRSHKRREEDAALIDLSSFGCRLEVAHAYAEGESVRLRFFDRDAMAAKVIWQKDGEMGCRFAEKIDLCLFRALTIGAN